MGASPCRSLIPESLLQSPTPPGLPFKSGDGGLRPGSFCANFYMLNKMSSKEIVEKTPFSMLNNSKAVKRLSVIVLRSFNLIKAIFLNDRTERLAYSNAQLVYKCQ